MNLINLSDEELLQSIARRDADAFELLYDRHAQVIYNLILRIVDEPRIAEELMQECFWQVWQKAGDYRAADDGAAWLCWIARDRALARVRQKAGSQMVEPARTKQPAEQSMSFTPYPQWPAVGQSWQQQQIRQRLASIPEEQRLILELAYFEGMTQREMADYLSLPIDTIQRRMQLGVEKLERLMTATGMHRGELS